MGAVGVEVVLRLDAGLGGGGVGGSRWARRRFLGLRSAGRQEDEGGERREARGRVREADVGTAGIHCSVLSDLARILPTIPIRIREDRTFRALTGLVV